MVPSRKYAGAWKESFAFEGKPSQPINKPGLDWFSNAIPVPTIPVPVPFEKDWPWLFFTMLADGTAPTDAKKFFCLLPCDWLSTVWTYSEQETENGPWVPFQYSMLADVITPTDAKIWNDLSGPVFCVLLGWAQPVLTPSKTWWRHQVEAFSALLSICAGNSPVPGKFPTQRPVTRSFDVYFDLCPDKRLSKQSWGWWFETLSHSLWRHRNGQKTGP